MQAAELIVETEEASSRLASLLLGDIPDERRHRRIFISLPLRFLADGGAEERGALFDMSPGGVSITAAKPPAPGARLVAYVDDIGRIEGEVVRHHPYGFAARLTGTQRVRDKLAERLTFYANKHLLHADDFRRHERVLMDRTGQMELQDGKLINCRVVDLSLSGAAIEVQPQPMVGTTVTVGRMRGQVVRHFAKGVGIRFLDLALTHAGVADKLTGRAPGR
jgi:hypothetical protein